jgi:hypothetical protein
MASMEVDQVQPKKRLMIREMVLENFKSYAGAQHVGPFHKVLPHLPRLCSRGCAATDLHAQLHQKQHTPHLTPCRPFLLQMQCFSAVVGPNGSGKSNVIDAMLFVFGRRAKQVRLGCSPQATLHMSSDTWIHNYDGFTLTLPHRKPSAIPVAAARTRVQQHLPDWRVTAAAEAHAIAVSCDTMCVLPGLQLRFNKVAELIHNSTYHRNLERACVTVYFQEIIDKVGLPIAMPEAFYVRCSRTAPHIESGLHSRYCSAGPPSAVHQLCPDFHAASAQPADSVPQLYPGFMTAAA